MWTLLKCSFGYSQLFLSSCITMCHCNNCGSSAQYEKTEPYMLSFDKASVWSHAMGTYPDCRNDADKAAAKLLSL